MSDSQSTVLRPRVIDLPGQVFGRLTVLEFGGYSKHNQARWKCQCVCGSIKLVASNNLRRGMTKSCGCVQNKWSHGCSQNSETYKTWESMKQRCYNKNHKHYRNYGGRGITVCKRWKDNFAAFLEDMGDRPPKATIDRIDNSLGYSPENCRWATRKQQQRNRRTNRLLTCNGETHCLAEWAEKVGLTKAIIAKRLRLNWSVERALSEPLHQTCSHLVIPAP